VGFVSLGCPKALVDSERILTQLSVEGYDIVPDLRRGATLVVVNTCGFIDSAVHESLDAIGEALAENGKVDRHRLPGQARRSRSARHTRTCWRSAARRTTQT
jgi:tRNA A37 methylthiotransferase MiaB